MIQKTTDKHQQWVKNVYIRKYVNTKLSENAMQKSYGHFSEVSGHFSEVSIARYNGLFGHMIHDMCTSNIGKVKSYIQAKCDA